MKVLGNFDYLITGSNGFIGRNLITYLLEHTTATVCGVDKVRGELSENFSKAHPGRFLEVITDLTKEENSRYLPDADFVLHLAAINGTQNFYTIPWTVYLNSLSPTLNLIQRYAESRSLKRFIYTSTSEVYAGLSQSEHFNGRKTNESVRVGFDDVQNSRWSYGGAKLAGEIGVFSANSELKMPFSIIRYHNVYGPSMGINHVIPDFIARGKKGVFELHGGDNVRSFIYIDDAIRATLAVAHHEESLNRIVHVGTQNPISMNQLAELIMRLSNWKGEVKVHAAPSGSTDFRCPDTSFLTERIGFTHVVELEDGIRSVIRASEV